MSKELFSIIQEIQNLNNSNAETESKPIVFISIGSAALMKQNNVLESKYNHQYPPCIQKLESLNRPIFIVLIDPVLEDPPHISLNHMVNTDYNNKYNNKKLHVFSIRKSVKYIGTPYYYTDEIDDITECFLMINNISMQNDWLTIVHDFSGRNINILTHLFNIRANNIIYGIDMGESNGCYINLDSPIYDLLLGNKIFNPHSCNIEFIQTLMNDCDPTSQYIIKQKLNLYTKSFFNFFSKHVLTIFRQLHLICVDCKQIILNPSEYIYLQNKYNIPFDTLIKELKYIELYQSVYSYLSVEFNTYFANYDINYNHINQIFLFNPPYSWQEKILLYIYYTPYYIKLNSLLI